MLIVLASLGLIRRHRPIDAESSANTSTGTVQFQYWASIGAHTGIGIADCHDGVHFQYGHLPSARTSFGIAAMAFISSMGTCQVPVPVLALPRWRSFPVWALAKCPYQFWCCHDGVHFQYGHLPSARTSIGIAAMAFISSMGTCQVPVPVLALPRWRSFPVWALAKCPHQYWRCRDGGVHFQYGHLPSARTSIGTFHYQQWQIFAAHTSEFYHTLE
jgi:hypothetical protein